MRIDQYAAVTSPPSGFELVGNDVTDTTMGPNGTTKRITAANLLAAAGGGTSATATDIPRVFVAGHSYAAGDQNTEGGENWPRRLAALLHAEEVTYAVTSAVLALDNTGAEPGGYASVLNALTPRVAGVGAYSVRNASPYLPLSPVAVFDYGFNDLGYLTSSVTANIAWYQMALTACCCVARAGGWFPDTDGSVAYGSGWSANTGTQAYGWPTNHQTSTTGSTVTITVPASFPGGEVDILTLAYSGGAKWSTVVDGGTAQVLNGLSSAYGANSGQANLVVQRLTGLAAGAHTIVVTLSSLDSGAAAFFQGWLIASPQAPVVALVNQPSIPGAPYTPGGSPAHSPVTSSDITALNTATAAVAAAFTDGNVVVADVAAAFAGAGGNVAAASPKSLYASDGLHPNAAGHALIAQTAQAAIRSAPVPGWARAAAMGIVMRLAGTGQEPSLQGSWSTSVPGGGGFAWFGKDRAGNAWLQLKISNGGSPSAGETIFTLPPGYQPSSQVVASGVSWNSGYSSTNPVALGIQANGQVQWFSGSPATELDLTWSWPANGLGS